MAVGEASDLWEVGHDDDLARDREAGQAATDREPSLAPDPRVHLVEDERGDIIEVRQDAPTREHHAGELSPAGRFGASGPSAYLFNGKGDFVDWTADMGDFYTVHSNFNLTGSCKACMP